MHSHDLKPDPGSYTLIMRSQVNQTIQVGKTKSLELQPGYYIYCGSAMGSGGIRARVSRHLKVNKNKHWHIDSLLDWCDVLEVWLCYTSINFEHAWSELLGKVMDSGTKAFRFGASDCTCQSHLFFATKKPKMSWIKTRGVLKIKNRTLSLG